MVQFTINGGEIVPKIEISTQETILTLKEKIKEKLGVEVDRQSLWYRDIALNDSKSIGAYGFRRSERLFLTVKRLPPYQKLNVLIKDIDSVHSSGYVKVKETDKVSDLMCKVASHWAIPFKDITLYRFNIKMQDNLPLYAYYINENSEIKLSVTFESR